MNARRINICSACDVSVPVLNGGSFSVLRDCAEAVLSSDVIPLLCHAVYDAEMQVFWLKVLCFPFQQRKVLRHRQTCRTTPMNMTQTPTRQKPTLLRLWQN